MKDSIGPYSKFSQRIVDGFGAFVALSLYLPISFFFHKKLIVFSFHLHLSLSSISSNITNAYKAGRSRYELRLGYRFLSQCSEIESLCLNLINFLSVVKISSILLFLFSALISKMTSLDLHFLLILDCFLNQESIPLNLLA